MMQNFEPHNATNDNLLIGFTNVLRNRLGNNFNIEIHNGTGNMPPSITITHNTQPRINGTIGITLNREIVGLNNMPATANNNITNMDAVCEHVQNMLLNTVGNMENLMSTKSLDVGAIRQGLRLMMFML